MTEKEKKEWKVGLVKTDEEKPHKREDRSDQHGKVSVFVPGFRHTIKATVEKETACGRSKQTGSLYERLPGYGSRQLNNVHDPESDKIDDAGYKNGYSNDDRP